MDPQIPSANASGACSTAATSSERPTDILLEMMVQELHEHGEMFVFLGCAELASLDPRGCNTRATYDSNRDCSAPQEYKPWFAKSDAQVLRFLTPFSSKERMCLMRAMFEEEHGPKELTEATGLTSGQVYHHLKVLRSVGYAEKPKPGYYRLSFMGRCAYALVTAVATHLDEPYFRQMKEEWREETQGDCLSVR